MLIFIITATILLLIDLISKAIFTGEGFVVIEGVLSVCPIPPNDGAAFGLLSGSRMFLLIMTFLILIGGIVFYLKFTRRVKPHVIFNLGSGFILGGALGNLYDRLFLGGGVRDFIMFDFFNFPVFNFADVFLNIGVVLLAIYFIFIYKGFQNADKS